MKNNSKIRLNSKHVKMQQQQQRLRYFKRMFQEKQQSLNSKFNKLFTLKKKKILLNNYLAKLMLVVLQTQLQQITKQTTLLKEKMRRLLTGQKKEMQRLELNFFVNYKAEIIVLMNYVKRSNYVYITSFFAKHMRKNLEENLLFLLVNGRKNLSMCRLVNFMIRHGHVYMVFF